MPFVTDRIGTLDKSQSLSHKGIRASRHAHSPQPIGGFGLSDEEADEFSALLEEVCPEDLVSTLETNTEELRDALAQARTLLGPDADRDMIAGAATAIVEFYTVKSRERTELEFAEQYQAQADRVRKRIEGLRLAKAAMAAGEVKPVY